MSLIEKFLKMATDDKLDIDIEPLLEGKEDKAVFEKWLKIFTELEPVAIVPALEKISNTYIMTPRDEIVLLSYVKFFEQNILQNCESPNFGSTSTKHITCCIKMSAGRLPEASYGVWLSPASI